MSMCITLLQLTQFSHGMYYQVYTVGKYCKIENGWICRFLWLEILNFLFIFSVKGESCYRTDHSVLLNLVFGFAYLGLFAHLFYNSYIAKKKGPLKKENWFLYRACFWFHVVKIIGARAKINIWVCCKWVVIEIMFAYKTLFPTGYSKNNNRIPH